MDHDFNLALIVLAAGAPMLLAAQTVVWSKWRALRHRSG